MVSSSKPFGKGIHVDQLLDYRGFLDVRYAVLAAGRFIAQLGLWIPGFYISKLSWVSITIYAHSAQSPLSVRCSPKLQSANTLYLSKMGLAFLE